MRSSVVEAAPAVPVKTSVKAKVNLIAWDPESPAHNERMVQQRIACGWHQDYIEKWRVLQRDGKMSLHWVVVSEDNPEKETKLAQHLLVYPGEAAPIIDTATTLGGKPRMPSLQSFVPVGHISVDAESPNPGQADPSKGLYCITALYISRAIQGGGIGGAAMAALESKAVNEPFCAKELSLDTLANENAVVQKMWAEDGVKPPQYLVLLDEKTNESTNLKQISNRDWYGRRGYKVWRVVNGHIQFVDAAGISWPLDIAFMKKTIA